MTTRRATRGPSRAPARTSPLAGRLVWLRTIRPDDLTRIETWWEEPEANLLDGGDHDGPSLSFRQIFRQRVLAGHETHWFMVESRRDGPIGYVLYRTYPEEPRAAEVAVRLTRKAWGKGYGTEAFHLFVRHLFRHLAVDRIWLTVYLFNPRAIRLYERIGFRDEETFVDEKGLEMLKMGITRSEHDVLANPSRNIDA